MTTAPEPSTTNGRLEPSNPLRILWYWPHPFRDDNVASSVTRAGDTLTIECLAAYRGQPITSTATGYDIVRDLPDVAHGRLGTARRILDRIVTHSRRALRRDRHVRSGRFDVLHIETSTMLDALTIRRLRRRLPVVVVVHDVRPHTSRLPAPVEHRLLGRIYREASALIVHHGAVRDDLLERFTVDADKIVVIAPPLTVPRDLAPDGVEERQPGGPVNVLFFGSFRANKGIDDLIATAEAVPPTVARFTIAGTGDALIEADVTEAATRLPHVEAEIGHASVERRAELYRAADLVVLPYRSSFTSQSAVLLDAYSFAVPVVVTDVGGIGPTVREDGTGWVIPADDRHALVAAVERAAADPDARGAAASRMRASAAHHDPVTVATEMRAVYDRVTRPG